MSAFGDLDNRYPDSPRRLRLGIVGGGRGGLVGHWHATGARLCNRWQFVAGAMSSNPEKARASAEDWMIAPDRAYDDFRAMAVKEAARPDGIEAVLICTPNDNHFAAASAFLDAGIDVILDKPMTTTLDDSLSLLALKRRAGVFLGMTYPYAFHAMVRQARHMIRAGAIGEVRQALVEYVQEWGATADASAKGVAWRLDPKRVGRASATGDIGTHAFHLLHHVLDQPITAARADFHVCGPAKPMEDTAFIALKLGNGAPGHMWITQVAPGNYCGLRFRIFGDKGGIEWDQEFPEQLRVNYLGHPEQVIVRGHGAGVLPAVERMIHLPRGHGEALSDAWGNLYTELALAVEARRGYRQLPADYLELPSAEDGVRGMKFIDACADSHEAGGVWKDCWIDP